VTVTGSPVVSGDVTAAREQRPPPLGHGAVTPATAAKLKALQDEWDGRASAPLPEDRRAAVLQLVKALTMQKADGVGQLAATTCAALCSKVLESPGEAKYRTVPWASGKAAYNRIAPSAAGLALLKRAGWAVEGEALVLREEAVDAELLKAAADAVLAALHAGDFA
jgi:hypothetical protein